MNKNRTKNLVKRIITFVMTLVLTLQICSVDTLAATKNWSLYYNPNGLSAENLTSWSKMVTTNKTNTKVNVDAVGGKAVIFAYSSNGISALFSKAGSASTTCKINKEIYISVSYSSYGTSINSPSGKFVY